MDLDAHTYIRTTTYLNNDLRFRCRNPNVIDHHGRNDTLLPASREKSRFRSLTWDQYDPVHQKYLEIGKSPRSKIPFHTVPYRCAVSFLLSFRPN